MPEVRLRWFVVGARSRNLVMRRSRTCGRNERGRITYGRTCTRASGDPMGSAAQFVTDIATGVYEGIVDAIVDQIVGVLTSGSAA